MTCPSSSDGFAHLPWQAIQPAPLLILLAMDGPNTLIREPFCLTGRLLHAKGWNVISLDMPCHGLDRRSDEPTEIKGWAARTAAGVDWISPFTDRVRSRVRELTEQGIADPSRVAIAGTSRGGFMALQAAAAIPGIQAVAAFAPVTDLARLYEFENLKDRPAVAASRPERMAPALSGRFVWIIMGRQDERVGTDATEALVQALEQDAARKRLPSRVTYIPAATEGHRSFPEWHDQAAAWLEQVIKNP